MEEHCKISVSNRQQKVRGLEDRENQSEHQDSSEHRSADRSENK